MSTFSTADLVLILRACAGEDDGIDLDGDIANRTFDELGYDSLALLETFSAIMHQTGVVLPEEELATLTTPGLVVAAVNERLSTLV